MTWKAPYRASSEVTQNYNDGFVTIYATQDAANPGYQPKPELVKKCYLRYEEKRLGVQRYYDAVQNQIKAERVIRVPRAPVTSQDVAETEDGRRYRVDLVQAVDGVYPPSLDITLTKYSQGVDM